jgi:glycosyltransferase involved in cell wall biosynthesis
MRVPAAKVWNVSGGVGAQYRPAPAADIAQARQRYALPERYLLFVGSVQERKNVRACLLAFADVCQRGLPHHLVIVGAKQWRYAEILNTLEGLAVKDRVHFTGYVEDADLPALYTGAEAFVFPSLYEGFGLPVLEAMACGTPVITSTTSSLPEVAGEAALLVDPKDVEALAAGMERVLTDPALRTTLRERGLQQAARFTWARTAQHVVDVYRAVLGSQ